MNDSDTKLSNVLLVVGAPVALAIVEIFHPHAYEVQEGHDVTRWLFVHYSQVFLFPLAALGLAALVRGR